MRVWSPSLKGVPLAGKLFYGAVLLLIAVLIGFGVQTSYFALSLLALLLAIPFVFVAPFVLGGRWRRQATQPTRRPVVRRRRY
jgi:hypothetical protein